MQYQGEILRAEFLSRPNRFIANCRLNGEIVTVHVKNTGRCRELLVPGATVLLEKSNRPARKTAYDLISVWKGTQLINMDSNAPNRVAADWIMQGGLGFIPTLLKPEARLGVSRFDFYLEYAEHPCYVEVKGVTLEENGIVRFPDAPTERGVKHLLGLAALARQGVDARVIFVVQMQGAKYLEANRATHPAFADALRTAAEAGVTVHAVDCIVTEDSVTANAPVPVHI